MKSTLIKFAVGLFFFSLRAFPVFAADIDLKDGDLLFADTDCIICDTIKETSHSHFTHVGIAVIEDGEVFVVEAYNDVEKVPLQKFLKRSYKDNQYKYAVGRIKDSLLAQKAALYAKKLIGKAFDNGLVWGEEKIYCTELIYFSYKHAAPDKTFFIPKPMTFTIHQDIWNKHFNGNMPQGRTGMFPQDLFESKDLDIIYNYFDLQK